MALPNFEMLQAADDYLVDLGQGVWLMDDHRWALKVWETQRQANRYTLVHADFHWDGCYDFYNNPEEEVKLVNASSNELCQLVAENELIGYDSFIAPAVRRGLIHTVHFYCLQNGPGDNALNPEFLNACGATQLLHPHADSLVSAEIEDPLIFDLCLDLFNRAGEMAPSDIWPNEEIILFLTTVRPLVRRAEMVTVSMSFNYSGTVHDTQRLTSLVLPILLSFRNVA